MSARAQFGERVLPESGTRRTSCRAASNADKTSRESARSGTKANPRPPGSSCRRARAAETVAATIDPAGRRPACRKPHRACPSRVTSVGESVVRGRRPGPSDEGKPSSIQNICAARGHVEAETGHGGRRLQPATRRRRRDHVAPAVDDIEMNRVAAQFRQRREGRLALAEAAGLLPCRHWPGSARRARSLSPSMPGRNSNDARARVDQLAACVVVGVAQQRIHRHVRRSWGRRRTLHDRRTRASSIRSPYARSRDLAGPCAARSKPFSNASCCRNIGPLAPRTRLVNAEAFVVV